MSFRRFVFAWLGAALVLGCASPPPPPPANPDVSILAIAIRVDVLVFPDEEAAIVHFVRVDDPAASGLVLRSNYVAGRYAYLTNVPPGRYAPVAASFQRDHPSQMKYVENKDWVGTPEGFKQKSSWGWTQTDGWSVRSTVYLPRSTYEETAVTVAGGQIAFMGELVVESLGDWEDADELQKQYYALLAPGHRDRRGMVKALDVLAGEGNAHRPLGRLKIDTSDAAWERFRVATDSSLAGRGWDHALPHPVGSGPR